MVHVQAVVGGSIGRNRRVIDVPQAHCDVTVYHII